MDKHNNIDELFKSQLQEMEVTPPPSSWENIESLLNKKTPTKTAVLFRWLSVAAVFIGLVVAGWFVINTNQTTEDIKFTETIEKKPLIIENSTKKLPPIIENKKVVITKKQTSTKNLYADRTKSKIKKEDNATSVSNKVSRFTDNNLSKIQSLTAENVHISSEIDNNKLNIPTNRNKQLSDFDKKIIAKNIAYYHSTAKSEANWSIGLEVAPSYSSQVTKHSKDYASIMNKTTEDATQNLGVGISVKYSKEKNWSIKGGIYYAQNGSVANSNSSGDMLSYADEYIPTPSEKIDIGIHPVTSNFVTGEQVAFSDAGIVKVTKKKNNKVANVSDSFSSAIPTNKNLSNISQVFDFIEIPLFLHWRLIDSKIDVDIIGGLQAGIVVGNNVYSDSYSGIERIGKIKDISPVNLSGSLGVGINYPINEIFSFSFEPRMNYYLNSINKDDHIDYRPYSIGLYSGIIYNF